MRQLIFLALIVLVIGVIVNVLEFRSLQDRVTRLERRGPGISTSATSVDMAATGSAREFLEEGPCLDEFLRKLVQCTPFSCDSTVPTYAGRPKVLREITGWSQDRCVLLYRPDPRVGPRRYCQLAKDSLSAAAHGIHEEISGKPLPPDFVKIISDECVAGL